MPDEPSLPQPSLAEPDDDALAILAEILPADDDERHYRVPCPTRFLRLPPLEFLPKEDQPVSWRLRWAVNYADRYGQEVVNGVEQGRPDFFDERREDHPWDVLAGPLKVDDPLAEELANQLELMQEATDGTDDDETLSDDLDTAWHLAISIGRRHVWFPPDWLPDLVRGTRDQRDEELEKPFGKVSRHHLRTLSERNLRVLVALRSILQGSQVQTVPLRLIRDRLEGTLSERQVRRARDHFVIPRLEELCFHAHLDRASNFRMAQAGSGEPGSRGITAERFLQIVEEQIREAQAKAKRGRGLLIQFPSQKRAGGSV